MKNIFIFLLAFLPIAMLAQKLDCCETVTDTQIYLHGKWKKKDGVPNEIYSFEFANEVGQAKIYKIKDDGSREIKKGSEAAISIIKTETGFKLRYDWKHFIIQQEIINLDSMGVTIGLGTRTPIKLYRISEL